MARAAEMVQVAPPREKRILVNQQAPPAPQKKVREMSHKEAVAACKYYQNLVGGYIKQKEEMEHELKNQKGQR